MTMRSIRDFGAVGDGQADDTTSIQHAIKEHPGQLYFPPGDYLVSETIVVHLDEARRFGLTGATGCARIIMAGPGPAFHLKGTHKATAAPSGVTDTTWNHERMPTLANLEILGRHEEADGVLLEGTMQSTFEGVLLRELRHGIHARNRARNVLVSHCHIYNNRGVGIFLDDVNLHQVIIASSHISYNRGSGIKILNGEIRNVQITGNDIEYNYDREAGEDAAPSAEIWIETSAEEATIREGTIASNTIQSRWSPKGANIYVLGKSPEHNHKAGMLAISGNLIGSQETNVHLISCRGISLSGNIIYSGHNRNMLVEGSRNITVTGNTFDHNPDYLPKELATGIRLVNSTDCTLSGNTIQDAFAGTHTVNTPARFRRTALVEAEQCVRLSLTGNQITDGTPYGVHLKACSFVNLNGCTIAEGRPDKKMKAAVRWEGKGEANMLGQCLLSKGTERVLHVDEAAGVQMRDFAMPQG
jgi:polygalacturonase